MPANTSRSSELAHRAACVMMCQLERLSPSVPFAHHGTRYRKPSPSNNHPHGLNCLFNARQILTQLVLLSGSGDTSDRMSVDGTKREFSPERLKGRKPAHCRRSGLNVGSPLHSRHSSEGCRRSAHDPEPTLGQTSILARSAIVLLVLPLPYCPSGVRSDDAACPSPTENCLID